MKTFVILAGVALASCQPALADGPTDFRNCKAISIEQYDTTPNKENGGPITAMEGFGAQAFVDALSAAKGIKTVPNIDAVRVQDRGIIAYIALFTKGCNVKTAMFLAAQVREFLPKNI